MKIIFISNLSENLAAGLNYSVPAMVEAQGKIDEVLWINLNDNELSHWRKIPAFHKLSEFGSHFDLELLPHAFKNPDVVIFEGFYNLKDVFTAKYLRKKNVPYVIVPRGSLTRFAQHIGSFAKQIKKRVANIVYFKEYTKKALMLRFLTNGELECSGSGWNPNYCVIPNGCTIPSKRKREFDLSKINAIYIGRIDYHNKGLDILCEAINAKKDLLREHNFKLNVYGPLRNYKYSDFRTLSAYIYTQDLRDLIELKGEVRGAAKEKALLESDVFFLTSRSEGHPMGLLEALSYGLPVLVTPGTNMADEIKHSDSGWVCQTDSVSIADALMDIIANLETLLRKSANALTLSKSYSWDNIAHNFHQAVASHLTSQ